MRFAVGEPAKMRRGSELACRLLFRSVSNALLKSCRLLLVDENALERTVLSLRIRESKGKIAVSGHPWKDDPVERAWRSEWGKRVRRRRGGRARRSSKCRGGSMRRWMRSLRFHRRSW